MKWSDDLSVGVELIDNEHKQLIDAVNSLFDACKEGKGRKHIAETMEFMRNYTLTHFGDEERLQQQCGYPDLANHRVYHAEFVKKVGEYEKKLEAEGPTIALVANFNSFVTQWLINHISVQDKKIGEHIKAKGGI